MLPIVGVCRFSLVGRGDWGAFRDLPADADLEAVLAERSATLFAPERIELRFRTFEHLTLRSIAGQTDNNLLFLVCASELMPASLQDRLAAICATVPQVRLRFFPRIDAIAAQAAMMADAGLGLADCVQFRLDDDDALFTDFVVRLREAATRMEGMSAFGVSFPDLVYAVTKGPDAGAYAWHAPFFSAGPAIRHPSRSIYGFGHFSIPSRLPTMMVPAHYALVTANGTNDSAANFARLRRRLRPIAPDELRALVARCFGYLTEEGLRVSGLAKTLAPRRGARDSDAVDAQWT